MKMMTIETLYGLMIFTPVIFGCVAMLVNLVADIRNERL